jgi:hypothetical protein
MFIDEDARCKTQGARRTVQDAIQDRKTYNGECSSDEQRKEGNNYIKRDYPWDTSDSED